MSTASHEGIVSFKSDLESLAYLLLFLLTGEVPWNEEVIAANAENMYIYSVLVTTKTIKEDVNKNPTKLPQPIGNFLASLQNISHLQRPNYEGFGAFWGNFLIFIFISFIYVNSMWITKKSFSSFFRIKWHRRASTNKLDYRIFIFLTIHIIQTIFWRWKNTLFKRFIDGIKENKMKWITKTYILIFLSILSIFLKVFIGIIIEQKMARQISNSRMKIYLPVITMVRSHTTKISKMNTHYERDLNWANFELYW